MPDPAANIAANTPPRAPQPPTKEPAYDEASAIDFPIPPDFLPPDDAKPGQPFQALGTFLLKDDGVMCLVAVDGAAVKGNEEKKEPKGPEEPAPTTMPEAVNKMVM